MRPPSATLLSPVEANRMVSPNTARGAARGAIAKSDANAIPEDHAISLALSADTRSRVAISIGDQRGRDGNVYGLAPTVKYQRGLRSVQSAIRRRLVL